MFCILCSVQLKNKKLEITEEEEEEMDQKWSVFIAFKQVQLEVIWTHFIKYNLE